MPLNVLAENRVFKGLTCPYTGRPVSVRVIAAGRDRPMYFSPDAFDPSSVQESPVKLLELAGTRNGIAGALTNGNELICPYTGNRMSIRQVPGGYCLKGGFSPSSPQHDLYKFASDMRMRGGNRTDDWTPGRDVVSFPAEREKVNAYDSSKSPDYALEYAERALKPILPRSQTVVVPGSVPKRGRQKKGA